MSQIVSQLTKLRPKLLEGLNEHDIRNIVSAAKLKSVGRYSDILSQGAPAARFALILEGRARHYYTTPNGDKLLLMWLIPGESAGTASLLPNSHEYLVSTETVRASTLLVWDRSVIQRLASEYPRLMGNVLTIASDYLHWYVAAHAALTCHSAGERLAHLLGTLVAHIGEQCPDGIWLEATNEELACAANVTSFTASRLLAEWSKQGIVRKFRGYLVVTNPAALWRIHH